MKKYDGKTFTENPAKGTRTRYHLSKLPQNLILFFKRFEKNMFFTEKNPTIVNFPLKKLSLEGIYSFIKKYVWRIQLIENSIII